MRVATSGTADVRQAHGDRRMGKTSSRKRSATTTPPRCSAHRPSEPGWTRSRSRTCSTVMQKSRPVGLHASGLLTTRRLARGLPRLAPQRPKQKTARPPKNGHLLRPLIPRNAHVEILLSSLHDRGRNHRIADRCKLNCYADKRRVPLGASPGGPGRRAQPTRVAGPQDACGEASVLAQRLAQGGHQFSDLGTTSALRLSPRRRALWLLRSSRWWRSLRQGWARVGCCDSANAGRGCSPADPYRVVTGWRSEGALGDPEPSLRGRSALSAMAPQNHVGRIHGGPRISQANALQLMATVVRMPAGERAVDAAAGAPDRVIVVLGYHEIGDDGRHGISSICRAAVRRAEELAAGGAAASGDLHGLVVERRAGRGRSDGRGVDRGGATSP